MRILQRGLVGQIERAVSQHLGRPWTCERLTDLADRSSHPAALLHGATGSVFAKVLEAPDAADQARAELSGLEQIGTLARVATAVPVGEGRIDVDGVTVLLFEALVERAPADRTVEDWRSIGQVLARLHLVRGTDYGWPADGFFGPLHQDNRGVASGSWTDFYVERRLLPWLRTAVDAGTLPLELARRVEALVLRLPLLVGPQTPPALLHGDAQHHNFVSTSGGAVVIDASPYYGHPEIDLALVDYFTPVPADLFAAYRELHPIDPGFAERRELWRVFGYLAVLTADGHSDWGATFVTRLAAALDRYV